MYSVICQVYIVTCLVCSELCLVCSVQDLTPGEKFLVVWQSSIVSQTSYPPTVTGVNCAASGVLHLVFCHWYPPINAQ